MTSKKKKEIKMIMLDSLLIMITALIISTMALMIGQIINGINIANSIIYLIITGSALIMMIVWKFLRHKFKKNINY